MSLKVFRKAAFGTVWPTPDGGTVLAASYGVLKVDSAGNIVWQKGLSFDPQSVGRYPGGYVVAGGSGLYSFAEDGSLLWSASYDFPSSYLYVSTESVIWIGTKILLLYRIYDTALSSYVPALVSLDTMGNLQTARVFGGLRHPGGIVWHTGGLYMVATDSLSNLVVVKLDTSGNVQWAKRYGVSVTLGVKTHSIAPLGNGLVVSVTGSSSFLLHLDGSGSVLWAKMINGNLRAMTTDSTGIYVAAYYVAKLDSTGSPIWSRTYNTDTSYNHIFFDVGVRGNYLFAYGNITSSYTDTAYLVRVSADNGLLSCTQPYSLSVSNTSITSDSMGVVSSPLSLSRDVDPVVSPLSAEVLPACVPVSVSERSSGVCRGGFGIYDPAGRKVRNPKGIRLIRTPEGVRRVLRR